jgi:hypothetical protein
MAAAPRRNPAAKDKTIAAMSVALFIQFLGAERSRTASCRDNHFSARYI